MQERRAQGAAAARLPAMVRAATREYRTWSIDSRRWANYQARPDDIVIATSPKCGTTWTQQIVGSLVFQDALPRPIPEVSPWPDTRFRLPLDQLEVAMEAQTHRRFLKTHLPIDGLPLYDQVRYIHVARDGRDAAMAMHNHYGGFTEAHLARLDQIGLDDPALGRPYPRLPKAAAAYFRLWLSTPVVEGQSDGMPSPSFFDLEAGYWAERRRPNVLLVHFNDLKADLDTEMRRIAAFLEIPVDEAIWSELVAAARFEAMKAAGAVLMPPMRTTLAGGADQFFNQGSNGRWRAVLDDTDQAAYAAKVREKFSPNLAAWIEGGRALAGEPATTAD
jgi:aryl sulfotransferase